jgi:hypothetical protein
MPSVATVTALRSVNPKLAPQKTILKLAPPEEEYDEEEYQLTGRKMTLKQLQAEADYEESAQSIPAPPPEPKRVITNAYLMGLVRENIKAEEAKKKEKKAEKAKKAPPPPPPPAPAPAPASKPAPVVKLPPQRQFTIQELADFDEIEYNKPFIPAGYREPYRENLFGINPRGDIIDADFNYLGTWDEKTQTIIPAKISKGERNDDGSPVLIHPADWMAIRRASNE